jgi:hypothetical protein
MSDQQQSPLCANGLYGSINQSLACRDQELNPEPLARKVIVLPLRHRYFPTDIQTSNDIFLGFMAFKVDSFT